MGATADRKNGRNRRSPADHFRQESEKRATMILDNLDRLMRLSNSGNNDYTPAQVRQLFHAIRERTAQCEAAFTGNRRKFTYASSKSETAAGDPSQLNPRPGAGG